MAERDTLRHGGLTVVTERGADGALTVTIHPGTERLADVVWAVPTDGGEAWNSLKVANG